VYQDVLYFVSPSQTIQMFNGSQLNNISDNRTQGAKSSIKAILDSFTLSDFEACVGFGYDQMACFSFPTQNLTFLYDISSGQWYKLSWAMTSGVFNSEEDQLVFGERVSAPGMLDQWFAAETDLGSSITSSYISRITDGGSPAAVKSFRYAVLLAPLQAGATATVTIIADPLGANIQTSQSISLQNFPNSHIISLPPIMTGSEVQVMISVTSTQKTEIQNVTVFGYVKRQFVSQG
ncbi:MAG: hypothetical protein ACREQ5_32960, partial [Candidatus Dormibacteria bacterium]